MPKQFNGKLIHGLMSFLFRLNLGDIFKFDMCEGFHMVYSAWLLSHRQEMKSTDLDIINVSAYANKSLFCWIRKSLKRISEVRNILLFICVYIYILLLT